MAHNIDMTGGRANMAFRGDRNDIWHRLGEPILDGDDLDTIQRKSGLTWTAVMVPALADISDLANLSSNRHTTREVEGRRFIVRNDNGQPLGYVSDGYKLVQPREVLEWFQRYIDVDSRFQLDVAGSLKKGEIIWATASYNSDMTVAGDKHRARLLMTTTFDGSGATVNKATMVRVVCNNTLDAALADDGKSVVKTRHNTRFDAARVGRELGTIAQGFEAYKAMGDAMARAEMPKPQIAKFFKAVLDIPFDANWMSLSGKKQNQFDALRDAYAKTGTETQPGTAWAALNAVTRYVDHDRSTRGGDTPDEARVLSSQFGSGAAMKAHAVQLLTDGSLIDKLVAATPAVGSGSVGLLDTVLGNTRLN